MLTIGNVFVIIVNVPDRKRKRGEILKLNLERLKQTRINKNISQEQIAKELGWKSRSQYSKRENGMVGIGADELIIIAKILGYTKEEIGYFFD